MNNSNGNGNDSDVEKSPQQKAWDTAREQARENGRSVRDEEIRCIKSKALSSWAKLFFWILSKICWEKSPFLYNHRPGAICILGSELKKYYAFPTKRLYEQNRPVKDKAGNLVTTRRTPGAIEELVSQGFIWLGKKPVRNIPSSKWPNVFNILCLVPQQQQSNLGLLEDVVVVEDEEKDLAEPQYSHGGVRVFLPRNESGPCQTPEKGLAKPPTQGLPSTNGGAGQTRRAGLAKHPRGDLPSTPVGALTSTPVGVSQAPPVVQAKPGAPGLAKAARRVPIKTSDVILTSRHNDGGTPPPEKQFQDWIKTLPKYPSELRNLEKDLNASLQKAKSPEARAEWGRRLAAVRMQLLGGPVEDKAPEPKPKPTVTEQRPTMTREQQKAAFEKVKAAIAAEAEARWTKYRGNEKAATKVAART